MRTYLNESGANESETPESGRSKVEGNSCDSGENCRRPLNAISGRRLARTVIVHFNKLIIVSLINALYFGVAHRCFPYTKYYIIAGPSRSIVGPGAKRFIFTYTYLTEI